MKSSQLGASTSEAEVTHIDAHGLWFLVNGAEHFLPYEQFPWFKSATVNEILDVELHHGTRLHWPSLDVDLCLESLEAPPRFPLICE